MDEGGQTAFPVANNRTFNRQVSSSPTDSDGDGDGDSDGDGDDDDDGDDPNDKFVTPLRSLLHNPKCPGIRSPRILTYPPQVWDTRFKDYSNLSAHCSRANLAITPRRRTAIMWYNHVIDPKTNWVGSLDPTSYHGGCDVIRGHKWIVNNWINVFGDNYDDMRTWTDPDKMLYGDSLWECVVSERIPRDFEPNAIKRRQKNCRARF